MFRVLLLTTLIGVTPVTLAVTESPHESGDEQFVQWLWNYLTDGASVTAGIGGRSIKIEVTEQSSGDHGVIAENKEDEIFLLYSTRASYFGDSAVGYAWLLNLSTFNLEEQEVSGSAVDLNTNVDGYFASVVPTLFYNIGDRYRGHYLRAGVGIGLGVARFEGEVVLTDSSQPDDRVHITNGSSDVFTALGVFLDYQYENFALRLSSSGPNLNQNGYDINITGTSLVFGYTYYLNF